MIWVCGDRSGGWGHLLVCEVQALSNHIDIRAWILSGGRGTSVFLHVWGQRRLSPCGYHGGGETMGLMCHGVQCQHDAGNLYHPFPRGQIPQQTSSEHVIHGPMTALIDGIALRMVGRGQDSLDSQGACQLPPDITNKFPATV